MRAGLLTDFVEIQRNNPTQGDSGEEIDNWVSHIFTWMRITATVGDENITGFTGRMRYADVVHTDRILFESRIFDIVSVLDKRGIKRDLQLELREDTSG